MNTKLTLRLDEDLIRGAKRRAAARGTSVSRLVDYFAVLVAGEPPGESEVTPGVRRLLGVLRDARPADVDEAAYLEHLERKHVRGGGA